MAYIAIHRSTYSIAYTPPKVQKEAITMTKRGTRAPSGMGSITYAIRGGKKYWTGRVTLGFDLQGEQVRRSFSGYKKTEVIEKMQRALATQNVAGYVDKGDGTLETLMPLWLHQVKAKEIRTTTLAKYDTIIKKRIHGHPYGKMKTRDITIRNLQNYIDTLHDTGHPQHDERHPLRHETLFRVCHHDRHAPDQLRYTHVTLEHKEKAVAIFDKLHDEEK